MKVTTQFLDNRQVEVAVEVEPERVREALQKTARRIAGKINIPGFRRGKAPYAVVVRAIGEEALYEEMFEESGPRWLEEALQGTDLTPFRPGQISSLQRDPLSFKVILPLPPVVELGDYRNMRIPFEVPAVTEEEMNQALEQIRYRHAVLEPVGDGPAEWEHAAALEIDATLSNGERLDFSGIADPSGYIGLMLDDQKDLLPGFSENIIGMMTGEERDFDLHFPDDFENEQIRGQMVHCHVRLHELKRFFVPPLDDALAQTVGHYETLDQLQASIHQQLEQEHRRVAEAAYVEQCLNRLMEMARVEFPPVLVEEELDRMMEETEKRLRAQKMDMKEFLNIKKQTLEEYRSEMRPRAEAQLRRGLILRKFIEAENIARDGSEEEYLQKVLSRLVAIGKGEAPPLEATAPQAEGKSREGEEEA